MDSLIAISRCLAAARDSSRFDGIGARDQEDDRRHSEEREQRRREPGAQIRKSLTERLQHEPLLQKPIAKVSITDVLGLERHRPSIVCVQCRGELSTGFRPAPDNVEPPDAFLRNPWLVGIGVAVTEVLGVVDVGLHHQGDPHLDR